MSYTRATLAAFQEIFTAFASVTDAQYDYWAVRAERVVTDAFGDDQAHGTLLLTAHYLASNGLGTDVDSQRSASFGGATRVKSGSLELSWSDGKQTTGTRYGDEALALIRTYRGGPRVAGTGTVPVYPSYGGLYVHS